MSNTYITPGDYDNIKIANGNCLDYMKKLPDEYIDLVVTDPPYKMTARGNSGTTGGMLTKKVTMTGQVFKHNNIDCTEYAPEFYRLLKDGSHCYVMTNHVNLIHMLNTFTKEGFHFIKSLIWDKGNKIMGRFYMSQYEYILFFRKGKGVQINNCGTSDIISIKNIKTKDKNGKNLHDTEKPVELMEILVKNSSKEGQIVLDPFMGIGSTGLACMNTGRKFIGYELDEMYYNVSKERMSKGDL